MCILKAIQCWQRYKKPIINRLFLSRVLFFTDGVSHWVEDIEKHLLAWLSPMAINTILNVSYPSATAKITEGTGQR